MFADPTDVTLGVLITAPIPFGTSRYAADPSVESNCPNKLYPALASAVVFIFPSAPPP